MALRKDLKICPMTNITSMQNNDPLLDRAHQWHFTHLKLIMMGNHIIKSHLPLTFWALEKFAGSSLHYKANKMPTNSFCVCVCMCVCHRSQCLEVLSPHLLPTGKGSPSFWLIGMELGTRGPQVFQRGHKHPKALATIVKEPGWAQSLLTETVLQAQQPICFHETTRLPWKTALPCSFILLPYFPAPFMCKHLYRRDQQCT